MLNVFPRVFLVSAISLSALSPSLAAAPADFSAIEIHLNSDCASGSFAGVVLVHRPDGQLYQHVCGPADAQGTPITLDTRFKMFSTSKLLTAIAVMRLVERGKIKLDDSIAIYVPGVPRSWRAVTIHQLLHHRSGLPDQTNRVLALYRTDYQSALKAVLAEDRTAGTKPVSAPGNVWKYNNFGYDLLAAAAAHAMHLHFDEVLERLVFQPAQMTHATVEKGRYVDGKLESIADPELAQGFNGSPAKREPATSYEFIQLGAGSVHATAGDFLALDAALKNGKVLKPATLAEMETDISPTDASTPAGRGYGLGMMVRGMAPLKYVGHDGGNNGFISDFERFPDGAALIVLSNVGYAQVDWIRAAVAALEQDRQAKAP
jgi:CubicO group peptidase (beta-lactamase class C family)